MSAAASNDYYWRLFATGLGFVFFGVGALVLTIGVFPLFFLLPQTIRASRARWLIHKSFASFMWAIERMGLMRFEVIGRDRMKSCANQLILANHPTLIDVVALMALMPNVNCVVKQALWTNPFISAAVRAANYISTSQPEGVIDACVEGLKQPHPLIIFPEGTRTAQDAALRFQRGAAYIALRSRCAVLPVIIECEPRTLAKGATWYRIPKRKFTLRIKVLPAVNAASWISDNTPPTLRARRLTSALEIFFQKNLKNHGHIDHAEA